MGPATTNERAGHTVMFEVVSEWKGEWHGTNVTLMKKKDGGAVHP